MGFITKAIKQLEIVEKTCEMNMFDATETINKASERLQVEENELNRAKRIKARLEDFVA